jgi:hypothetical protein
VTKSWTPCGPHLDASAAPEALRWPYFCLIEESDSTFFFSMISRFREEKAPMIALRKRFLSASGIILLTVAPIGMASIGFVKRGWKSGVVNTCWTDDLNRFQKEVKTVSVVGPQALLPTTAENDEIQGWLRSAYSRERVGVEFHGFYPCSTGQSVDALMIYNTDLGKGISGVGSPGNFSSSGSLVNRLTSLFTRKPIESGVAFNQKMLRDEAQNLADQMTKSIVHRIPLASRGRSDLPEILERYRQGVDADIRKWAVLHEYGHLTGLLHEERRKDVATEQPGFCAGVANDAFAEGTEANPESRFGTDFDPFSVMNYCRKNIQILYRKAILACEIGESDLATQAEFIMGKVPATLAPLIASCDFIRKNPLTVDLSPRDVAGLRDLYLKEIPAPGPSVSYKKSEVEKRWSEILYFVDRLYL